MGKQLPGVIYLHPERKVQAAQICLKEKGTASKKGMSWNQKLLLILAFLI